MTLDGKSKIYQHKKAKTAYLPIPSMMVQDSQFPFKPGDEVELLVDDNVLIIRKSSGSEAK